MKTWSWPWQRASNVEREVREITAYLERSAATVKLDEFRVVGHCYRFRARDIGAMQDVVHSIASRYGGEHWKGLPGNNYFVMARPGCGKTTFAKQLGCMLKDDKGVEHKRIDLKLPNSDLRAFFDDCVTVIDQGKSLLITIDEFHRLLPRGTDGGVDTMRVDMTEPFRFSALNHDDGRPVICMFITSLFQSDNELRRIIRKPEVRSGEEFERRIGGRAALPSACAGDKFIVAAATAYNYCFIRIDADALLALTLHPSIRTVADVSEVIKGLREVKGYTHGHLTRRDLSGFPKYSEEDLSPWARKLLKDYNFGLNLECSQPPGDLEDDKCKPKDCGQYLLGLVG